MALLCRYLVIISGVLRDRGGRCIKGWGSGGLEKNDEGVCGNCKWGGGGGGTRHMTHPCPKKKKRRGGVFQTYGIVDVFLKGCFFHFLSQFRGTT